MSPDSTNGATPSGPGIPSGGSRDERLPPHDVGAERAALGAVFIRERLEPLDRLLTEDDFFLPVHRPIFGAMLSVTSRRLAMDIVTIAAELKNQGELKRLEGGEAYLMDLAGSVPNSDNIEQYAQIISEAAARRHVIALCANTMSRAYGGASRAVELAEDLTGGLARTMERAGFPTPGSPAALTTVADYLARVRSPGQRFSTGLPSMDRASRGGPPPGKRIVVVGAPSSAKSTLAAQWSHDWELAGAAVVFLAADESPESIAVRIGQLIGYVREDLEAEDDDARRAAATILADRKILLLDGEDVSLEDAAAALDQLGCAGQPRVLVVDSLQTIRCVAASVHENRRDQIVAVMGLVKAIARSGAIVVAISEMARAGYRSGDRAQDTSVLASAKESGAVEYGADLLIGLRAVRDQVGQIDVEIAKNRLGHEKPELRLRLDFASARLAEIATPDPEATARTAGAAKLQKAKERVIRVIMGQELRTANAVATAAGGTRQHILAALSELRAEAKVVVVNGVLRVAQPEVADG